MYRQSYAATLIRLSRFDERLALAHAARQQAEAAGCAASDANPANNVQDLEIDEPLVAQQQIEFPSRDGVVLGGTIVTAAGRGPRPGLVIIQGRSYGPRSRFLEHAVQAAQQGVATIVFDGRGVGRSGGARGQHTRGQRLDDARAALRALRSHPRVDATRVGMLGHSAGGWVVPVVAQSDDNLAFVVLHSAPAVDLATQQAQVVRELALRAPSNPHDSDAALRALTVPTLALYGETDYVVPPAHNVPVLERALQEAGNRAYRIVVFAGAGHDLTIPGHDGQDGRRLPRITTHPSTSSFCCPGYNRWSAIAKTPSDNHAKTSTDARSRREDVTGAVALPGVKEWARRGLCLPYPAHWPSAWPEASSRSPRSPAPSTRATPALARTRHLLSPHRVRLRRRCLDRPEGRRRRVPSHHRARRRVEPSPISRR